MFFLWLLYPTDIFIFYAPMQDLQIGDLPVRDRDYQLSTLRFLGLYILLMLT